MIATSRVTDRRELHFNDPDELMADVAKVEAAAAQGRLRHAGNWTAGQTLGHLATWIDYAYDGYPMEPPWFIKMILRFRKNSFMRGPLPRGVKIPGVENGTYGTELLSLEEGSRQFHVAWDRLRKQQPPLPNIIFGPLTHEEWINMQLRHAELHLGFLHP